MEPVFGYYKLTVYDFIKHLSDKRGAHIDQGIAPLVKIINGNKETKITPVQCFAVQLIYAAKKQIPELVDYWPEMPELVQLTVPENPGINNGNSGHSVRGNISIGKRYDMNYRLG